MRAAQPHGTRFFVVASSSLRARILLACLAFVLGIPSLDAGIGTLDDPSQQRWVAEHLSGSDVSGRPWWDLYNLVDGNPETARAATALWFRPWWTSPSVTIRFFRPVAAATLYLDQILFGDNHVLAHLHSVLWYVAACFTVATLLMRLSRQHGAAIIAAFLFVVDDAHSAPLSWLACRNSLIAVTFFALALRQYHRAAQIDRLSRAFSAAAFLTIGLLAAENIVSGVPFFFAYAAFLDRRSLVRRATSLGVIATAVLGWFVFYRACGFGSAASGAYLDPLRDRAAFWSAAAPRYADLLRIQLGAPSALSSVLPEPVFAVLDTIGLLFVVPIVLVWIVRRNPAERELAFWLTCAALGFLPLISAVPHDRLLMHVGIAVWMLVGLCVTAMWRWASLQRTAYVVLVSALLLLPVASYAVASPVALVLRSGPQDKSVFEGSVLNDDVHLSQRSLVVVNAASLLLYMELFEQRARKRLVLPARMTTLGATADTVEVTKLDEQTFELYSSGYLLEPFAGFWRGPSEPMEPGTSVGVFGYEAQVLEVTEDGRPQRVRFHFATALDDASLRFVYFDCLQLRDFHFGPIGKPTVFPEVAAGQCRVPGD